MEWNRRNILIIVAILVLGFGSGGVMYLREEGGIKFVMFRLEKWADGLYGGASVMTAEEERFAKLEAERIRKVILVKYPSLQLVGRDVAVDRNGYLALFELAKDPDLQLLRDSEILNHVSEEKFDPTVIRKDLTTFVAIEKEIERMAALPERSNVINGRIHGERLPSAEVRTMVDYLLIQARLAATSGDEAESFRYISLAMNLTEHISAIEGPYVLSEVVSIHLRMGIRITFFQHILPILRKSPDFEKWNSILTPQTDFPRRYGQLLKGEFNFFTEAFLYAFIEDVPDPEQAALAYAKWIEASIHRYDKMSLDQAGASEYLPFEPFAKGISREGISLIKAIIIGSSTLRPIVGTVIEEHHLAAAIDLLIREKKGEDVSKLTETFLLNPYTGKPFAYDAATRTLDAVSGVYEYDIEALKLAW